MQPGWTNGVVTLRNPVEAGWYLNVRGIGNTAVLPCCEVTGEAIQEHPDIPGLENNEPHSIHNPKEKYPWPDLRFQ